MDDFFEVVEYYAKKLGEFIDVHIDWIVVLSAIAVAVWMGIK